MPSEQPLELGTAQPRGLALIVFTARSTLTLTLSFFGDSTQEQQQFACMLEQPDPLQSTLL